MTFNLLDIRYPIQMYKVPTLMIGKAEYIFNKKIYLIYYSYFDNMLQLYGPCGINITIINHIQLVF